MFSRQKVPVELLFGQHGAADGVPEEQHFICALLNGALEQIVCRGDGRKGGVGICRPFERFAR